MAERAPAKAKKAKKYKKTGKIAALALSVRLSPHAVLDAQSGGHLAVIVDGYRIHLGRVSRAAFERARALGDGIRLGTFNSDKPDDKELARQVRKLAEQGLVEYRLTGKADGHEVAVIEPQMPDYRPAMPKLGADETVVLSRFAYLRRRGSEMVLESPRSGALFRIADPTIAALLTTLATPQKVGSLRQLPGFPGTELLALLLDCGILFRPKHADDDGRRPSEGDDALVMWDFHDLLFHARSTEGRQANPIGGVYPHVDWIAPPPSIRPSWPGTAIDLQPLLPAPKRRSAAKLFRDRHSVRDHDGRTPITLAELSVFLDGTARVLSRWESPLDPDSGDGPVLEYTSRPYPSAGSAYELELYLTVAHCDGLARGFYHYDAGTHALTAIAAKPERLEAMLDAAQFAMDAAAQPQILITIATRFPRLSWKYSAIAYALTLKDVGGLLQTLYLMAADMGLGGCAVGTTNIDLFEKVTGIPFHIEGPVGQFTLGRPSEANDAVAAAPAGRG